jgi:hypothetical protein
MKLKYLILATITTSGLILSACTKSDFLEIRPGGNTVLTVDAIKTQDDLKKLMISAYAQ